MDYWKDVEPIHEMASDELEHLLDCIREDLKFLWTHGETNPKKSREYIGGQTDFNLNTLIHSIKKSLLYFFPDRKRELSEVVDANEANCYLDILEHERTIRPGEVFPRCAPTPLCEGVTALLKIYLHLGPQYPCRPGDPEDLEEALADLQSMEQGILKYVERARFYCLEDKKKEAAILRKKVEKRGQEQRQKQAKRHTWGGMTRDKILERNQRIVEHFNKTRLTLNRFAEKHAAEYDLKPRTIRLILSKTVGN